ncbi:MAG: hypothetical protein ACYTBV_11100 [Planctomycetota bacterium]|jgi:hypothetical protein
MELPDWLVYDIKKRWERFSDKAIELRQWFNINPRIVIGITCGFVLFFLVMLIWVLCPSDNLPVVSFKKEWYYDLNTSELFTARYGSKVPVKAPSGPLPSGEPAGVRAYVFSYAEEPNELELFIAFLEKPDPNEKQIEITDTSSAKGGFDQWSQGRLIRREEDKRWYQADSSEGRSILEEAYKPNEKNQRPSYCKPR